MEVIIAGQLFWRDHEYLLVDPNPILEHGRHWISDDMKEFIVCQDGGKIFHLVVTPPFAVSYRRQGEKIQIKAQAEEEAEILNATQEAFDMFKFDEWLKGKPAELSQVE